MQVRVNVIVSRLTLQTAALVDRPRMEMGCDGGVSSGLQVNSAVSNDDDDPSCLHI